MSAKARLAREELARKHAEEAVAGERATWRLTIQERLIARKIRRAAAARKAAE